MFHIPQVSVDGMRTVAWCIWCAAFLRGLYKFITLGRRKK